MSTQLIKPNYIVAVVESSVTVVYPRFHQTSAGGFDDLDGLLCVQRRLKFKSGRNETLVFAAVVEPNKELKISIFRLRKSIGYFIVLCSVSWPLNPSDVGVDLALIQTPQLLSCKCN